MSSTSTSAWWYIRSELGKQKTLPRSSIKAVCQPLQRPTNTFIWAACCRQPAISNLINQVYVVLRRVWSRVVQLTPVPGTLGGREGLPSPKSNTNSTVATSLTSLDHTPPSPFLAAERILGELQFPCSPITVNWGAFGYQSVLAVKNRRPPVQRKTDSLHHSERAIGLGKLTSP